MGFLVLKSRIGHRRSTHHKKRSSACHWHTSKPNIRSKPSRGEKCGLAPEGRVESAEALFKAGAPKQLNSGHIALQAEKPTPLVPQDRAEAARLSGHHLRATAAPTGCGVLKD